MAGRKAALRGMPTAARMEIQTAALKAADLEPLRAVQKADSWVKQKADWTAAPMADQKVGSSDLDRHQISHKKHPRSLLP